jgi:hypothetical protein
MEVALEASCSAAAAFWGRICRWLAASRARVAKFGRRCLFPRDPRGVEWRQGDLADTAALASLSSARPKSIVEYAEGLLSLYADRHNAPKGRGEIPDRQIFASLEQELSFEPA